MTELLSAIGKRSINNYLRFSLERELEEIATAYRERRDLLKKIETTLPKQQPGQPTLGRYHKDLQQHRKDTARRLVRRKRFGPVYDYVMLTGTLFFYLQANPDADENELRGLVEESIEKVDHAKIEADEDEIIGAYLDSLSGDYRKSPETKLLVEPFLDILERHKIVPSPRKLPRTRMMEAFFNWVGVEPTLRPQGIPAIARNLKHKLGRKTKLGRNTKR